MDPIAKQNQRLLTASVLLIGGSICATIPAASTIVQILGTMVTAVTGGVVANDSVPEYLKRISVRLQDSEQQLSNHDLTKAVGLAIALLIKSVAESGKYPEAKQDLQALAEHTAKAWPKVAKRLKRRADDTFEVLQDETVSELFSGTLAEFLNTPVLARENWRNLFKNWVCVEAQIWLEEEALAAVVNCLCDRFPLALREVLKADFEEGGKAFAGLTLTILSTMQGMLKELLARPTGEDWGELKVSLAQELQSLAELRQQLENNEDAFRELAKKIDLGLESLKDGQKEIQNKLDGIENEIKAAKRISEQVLERNAIATIFINREHLRPSTKNFQGRKDELKQLHQWQKEADCIGIIGDGGYGKSTLAAKCYEEFTGFGQQNKFWLDLRQGNDFKQLTIKIIEKFTGKSPQNLKDENDVFQIVRSLINFLRDEGRYLLVLDNFETVLTLEGKWKDTIFQEFLTQWQKCGEKSTVLLTTRIKPEGRRIEWLSLGSLDETAGADLLRIFKLTDSWETLKEYSRLLDGRPLSLEIFANLVRQGQKQELTELLNDPEVSKRSDLQLVLLLQRSFYRFSESIQSFLLCLTVYSQGTFTLEEAQVQIVENIDNLENILQQFVDGSLLQQQKENNKIYEFHPEVLHYLQKKAGDLTEAHQRAISFYQCRLKPREEWETVEDVGEYLEIFHHWYELGEYETAFDSIRDGNYSNNCVARFLDLQGYNQLIIALYTQLITDLSNHENWRYSACLVSLGNAYYFVGDYQQAIAFQQQSLEITRQIGNTQGEANSLGNLGSAYGSLGDYQQAIAFQQQSLEITRQIGNKQGEANSLGNLGNAYQSLGDYNEAIAFQQQSLEIERQIGNKQGEAVSLCNLGNAYESLGDYQQAIAFQQRSLAIKRQIGDKQGEAVSLGNLGNAYYSLGDYQQAIAFQQQSLEIERQIGDKQGEANSLIGLGNAYESLGDYEKAIAFQQQSLEITRQIGDKQGEAASLNNLGNAYKSLGDYQQAIAFQQQSLAIQRQIGDRRGEANSVYNLGIAYGSLGDYQQAIAFQQQSLAIKRQIGDRRGEANSLYNLSLLYHKIGRIQDGIKAGNQANTIYQALDLPLNAYPYPKWMKAIAKFAQRNRLNLILCFILGIFAFPFALIWFILIIIYRLIRNLFQLKRG